MNKSGDPIVLVNGSISRFAEQTRNPGLEIVRPDGDPTHPNTERRKVLIVDDHRLIADTLAEILENAGFDTRAAYDGWQALDIAGRFHPDWLLTDVLMPQMNGVELAVAMRQAHPATAILLFSGQAGVSEILNEGLRRGYTFELIAKPVHPMKLIERLRQK